MTINSEPASNLSPRILIVDDEPIVLKALAETLKERGYAVTCARSAQEGLELVRQEQFAAVVSDQRMPRMLGLEFLERVKQLQPLASRVLVTAVLNVETLVEAINKGEVHRFLTKPWLCEELIEAVRAAVELHDSEVQKAELLASLESSNDRLFRLNNLLVQQAEAKARELRKARALVRRAAADTAPAARRPAKAKASH